MQYYISIIYINLKVILIKIINNIFLTNNLLKNRNIFINFY